MLDFDDQECHISNGSIRDYAIVRSCNIDDTAQIISTYCTVTFQPYFCGQEPECTRHNSRQALMTAIENVERHYPVVGVLEEMDSTLRVMQAVLPRFFNGIHNKFGGDQTCKNSCWKLLNSYWGCNEIYWLVSVHFNKQSYSEQSQTRDKENSTQEVETIIKDQLITEYEFYNYLKRRLAYQAKALLVQW